MHKRPKWQYLLISGILAAVLLFWVSAPFNARTKALLRNTTQWNPKRIRQHPADYLSWAMEQSLSTRNTLEAHRLALLSRRHAIKQAELEAAARHGAAENLLAMAKSTYQQAAADNNWPAHFEDASLQKEALQRRIVSLHRASLRHQRLVDEHQKLQPMISLRLDQIAERIGEVDDLQARLSATVELVSLSQSVEDCRRLHKTVSDILHMNNAVGEVAQSPGIEAILDDRAHMENFEKAFAAVMEE